MASYENPTQEEGELDYPTHLYNSFPQWSQCNQRTKPQKQSRMLDFSFSPHICIQQNLKKTPPKSLLNNLAWNVYPLTKKHKITRKYKVLKPFPGATIAYTVYLFQFLYARQDLRLSVQHRAQGNTKDTQLSFLMGMGISTEEKEHQFTAQEVTAAHSECNSPVCTERCSA